MHIHIIGICGTFMGSLALLARGMGMKVTGCDLNVYPPMSDQLHSFGIKLIEGFAQDQSQLKPDLWVIGNVATRTFPIIELILNEKLPYISGPSFLSNYILKNHDVIAVSGTHGKTTTSSILAWIFEFSGYKPGFLIGGLPHNFGISARNGKEGGIFVVEADEYDTAFFDKRSKFLHYTPKVAILNNLEFDHADIFCDLREIENQFHHWIKTIPSKSKIIINKNSDSLAKLVDRGIWSEIEYFNIKDGWRYKNLDNLNESSTNFKNLDDPYETFLINDNKNNELKISTHLLGEHNKSNILAAVAAAKSMGVPLTEIVESLKYFQGIKKRMELKGEIKGVKVFDDFAHHPTAIKATIQAAKKKYISITGLTKTTKKNGKLLVVFEPRSNSMKIGAMQDQLAEAFIDADMVFIYNNNLNWDIKKLFSALNPPPKIFTKIDQMINQIINHSATGDIILIMSNGSFEGIHNKILNKLTD